MIIGLCGTIGSGKDTFANELVSKYNFKKISFAGVLKDVLSSVFNWDRNLLEGDTEESRVFRNTVDEWWSERLSIQNLTPRKMLQTWGTDLCRKHFHNEIWIAALEKKCYDFKDQNIVITDCRFPDEIECCNRMDGITIKIIRNVPDWSELALKAYNNCQESIDKLKELGIHESEWKVWVCETDLIIQNNGSLEEFLNKIQIAIDFYKQHQQ
jgi:hypothetical protein